MAKETYNSEGPEGEVTPTPLSAPLPEHEDAVFVETRDIPLEQISLADNVRQTMAGVNELASSFTSQGQLEPCRVRLLGSTSKGSPNEAPYQLVFGYRRHSAAVKLGWPTLRCEVYEMGDEASAQQISENQQREPLSPMEEARMMERMRASADPPLRKVEIAQALGCDPTYVVQRLKLLTKLAPAGQEAIEAGKLSVSVVEEIMRLDDEQEQEKAVKNAVRYGWSVRQTLHHVKRVQGDRAQAEEIEAAKAKADAPGSAVGEGENGTGPTSSIPTVPITQLPRLAVRDGLSEEEVRRGVLYALIRNGMDRELLDYLAEKHQVAYEYLWLYVSHLSDEQVGEFTRAVLVRYLSAPHRYPSLEAELRSFYGTGPDENTSPVVEEQLSSIDPFGEE